MAHNEQMEQRVDTIGVATIASIVGWAGGKILALTLSVPPWFAQITLAVGICATTVTTTHFLKRWLNRRWPDRHKRQDDEEGES
jgi:uncharacterized membrane protein YeiH